MVIPIIKKKCKACGNSVLVERVMHTVDKAGVTPSPNDCATCRTLGVEKAIEERLMTSRKNYKTKFEITKGSSQLNKEREKKTNEHTNII